MTSWFQEHGDDVRHKTTFTLWINILMKFFNYIFRKLSNVVVNIQTPLVSHDSATWTRSVSELRTWCECHPAMLIHFPVWWNFFVSHARLMTPSSEHNEKGTLDVEMPFITCMEKKGHTSKCFLSFFISRMFRQLLGADD